jgi:hypothetical protein
MAFLLSPIGRWLGGAVVIVVLVGGIYMKGRSDGSATVIDRINVENSRAKQAADEARARTERDFDAGRVSDDEFKRR